MELSLGMGVLIRVTYTVYANANNIIVFDRLTCYGVNVVQGLGIAGSKTVLVAIAFDRFMAVYKPLHYSKNDSKMFVYAVAGLAVFFCILTSGSSLVGLDNSITIAVCSMGAAGSKTLDSLNLSYSGVFLFLVFRKLTF